MLQSLLRGLSCLPACYLKFFCSMDKNNWHLGIHFWKRTHLFFRDREHEYVLHRLLNFLNTERTYKGKLSGSARQSEIGILCFDWLIHPGVSYSREIWIFSEREGSFKAFYGIQPWVFPFLFNVIIQAKSHFAIFQVLLFPISLHWIWNSLRNNSVLFNLHFVCTIITLINLNNFNISHQNPSVFIG